MTTVASPVFDNATTTAVSRRAGALADRLEQGARALAAVAAALTDDDWQTRIPGDGRKVGVVVHHVATMYPLEIQLAQALAAGQPVTGVTWDQVHHLNAHHAAEHDGVPGKRRSTCSAAIARPRPRRSVR